MDRYGYYSWIADIKELVRVGKLEIIGSAAYHPILSKLPKNMIEKQIILNEYGLGYYLGDQQNLEGEPAILLHNVVGFFSPELSVSERVLSVVDSLGYKWMAIDESAIPFDLNYQHKYGVYQYKDYSAKLVCRNRSFSNMLSFKRDLDTDDIVDSLKFFKANERSFAIIMDGEFFGHHYGEGFLIFDKLVESAKLLDIGFVTMSEYVEDDCCSLLKDFTEASWGASDDDMSNGNPYPMWSSPQNEVHKLQWDLINQVLELHSNDTFLTENDDYATLPIWNAEGLSKITNLVLRKKVAKEVLLQKALHSDQFWWASKETLPAGEYLYDENMIKRGLQIIENFAELYIGEKDLVVIKKKIDDIKKLISLN
jgi:predicted glycosyl hydrolase (DUF1957 family)